MRLTAGEGCQLTGRNRRDAVISIGHVVIQVEGCDNAQLRALATWSSGRAAKRDLRQTHQRQDVDLSAANFEGAVWGGRIARCTTLCRPKRGGAGGWRGCGGGRGAGVCGAEGGWGVR